MTVTRLEILKHELAHCLGFLMAGAQAVKLVVREDSGDATPSWPDNRCSAAQFITGIVAGRAFVTEAMDVSLDEAELAVHDPEFVAAIAARVLPIVADRLECAEPLLAEMLAAFEESDMLILTPQAFH